MGECDSKGCRALITSIINCSINDLLTPSVSPLDRTTAIYFVKKDNPLFKFYCILLDYEPEYLEKKIWKYVRKCKYSKVSKLRHRVE